MFDKVMISMPKGYREFCKKRKINISRKTQQIIELLMRAEGIDISTF